MPTDAETTASVKSQTNISVPFFRPSLTAAEVDEVVACLKSGWLTSGPRVKQFEEEFAAAVGAKHAVAVNSCTAALHLAAEALGLKPGEGVLVPTMTFAATAEVVRYLGGVPILVDCDQETMNVDLADAKRKLTQLRNGELPEAIDPATRVVGIMPVHVGGLMCDLRAISEFCGEHRLWNIEDGAHALPAAWRASPSSPWQRCGEKSADVSCYSFYANKSITTGEGGMAVTNREDLADRMRIMSLHGLSRDAWERYSGGGSWDYQIIAPGFKYNLTDIAAAIGIHQLRRAEEMRRLREEHALAMRQALADVDELELPPMPENRVHTWHLLPIRLRVESLSIDRNRFIDELRAAGVGCSVHWRPLHLHPYYRETFGWKPEQLPVASAQWLRLVSLPLFPDMSVQERGHVVETVRDICRRHRR